jgi:hypothetical protein
MDEPLLYDTREAARLLSLSAMTLKLYRMKGGGPKYIKVRGRAQKGQAVRYTREALIEWVRLQPEVSNTLEAQLTK